MGMFDERSLAACMKYDSAPVDRQAIWPAWDGREPWPGDNVLKAWE